MAVISCLSAVQNPCYKSADQCYHSEKPQQYSSDSGKRAPVSIVSTLKPLYTFSSIHSPYSIRKPAIFVIVHINVRWNNRTAKDSAFLGYIHHSIQKVALTENNSSIWRRSAFFINPSAFSSWINSLLSLGDISKQIQEGRVSIFRYKDNRIDIPGPVNLHHAHSFIIYFMYIGIFVTVLSTRGLRSQFLYFESSPIDFPLWKYIYRPFVNLYANKYSRLFSAT